VKQTQGWLSLGFLDDISHSMPTPQQTDLVVTSRVVIPAGEFEWSFARSSGPGGQNVNKVNSKAVLRWNPQLSPALPGALRDRFLTRYGGKLTEAGELIITSEESRDQSQNTERCLEKLRELIQTVVTPPRPRRPTKPTKGSQRRRLAEKQQNSQKKQGRGRPRAED
jgi:ribosome-associated protein